MRLTVNLKLKPPRVFYEPFLAARLISAVTSFCTENSEYMILYDPAKILQSHTRADIQKRRNSPSLKPHVHPSVHGGSVYSSQDMKPPKCPSVVNWFKKGWCTEAMGDYSAARKNEISSLSAMRIDRENITHREVSAKEVRQRQVVYDVTYT